MGAHNSQVAMASVMAFKVFSVVVCLCDCDLQYKAGVLVRVFQCNQSVMYCLLQVLKFHWTSV